MPAGLCHRRQIDPAIPRDRNILDCTTREAAARPHRGMLDRRHHELVARVLLARSFVSASILASVPPEVKDTLPG